MRAGPVNLATTAAAPELLIIDPGQRLELIDDLGFLCRFQQCVAKKAAGKWRQTWAKIKSAQNLDRLFQRILRAHIIAVTHRGMHQKAAVAGEESAPLIVSRFDQLPIFGGGIAADVDPEQSQVADQFSQMTVSDKLLDIAHLQSIFREKSGTSFARWINIDRNILR